jgi:hypothetical protein
MQCMRERGGGSGQRASLMRLLAGVAATALLSAMASSTTPTLWFVTDEPANDVLALAQQALPAVGVRHGPLDLALAGAQLGDAVLVLADDYPWRFTTVPAALLSVAREKKLGLYLEYLDDLPGFNRSARQGPAGGECLDHSGGPVVINISTKVRPLCACLGSGPASTMRYTGVLCGASKDRILWQSMVNLNPCADVTKGSTCAWSAKGQAPDWIKLFTGSCGVAPTDLPGLPTHLCTSGPPPPAPRPAPPPPSVVTQTSWKQRGVVTTDEAAAIGLPRDTIMLPQGSYTNAWCGAPTGCTADAGMPPGCAEACNTSILALAKVAGVYIAPYGAEKSIQTPTLFEHDIGGGAPPALIATTKLTSIVSGRFGPASAWRSLWIFLLQKLGVPPATAATLPHWQPVVGPAYDKSAALPSSAAVSAVRASAEWLVNRSKLISDAGDASNGATTCCIPNHAGQSTNECGESQRNSLLQPCMIYSLTDCI